MLSSSRASACPKPLSQPKNSSHKLKIDQQPKTTTKTSKHHCTSNCDIRDMNLKKSAESFKLFCMHISLIHASPILDKYLSMQRSKNINFSRFDYKDVTYVSKRLSLVNYLIDSACVRLCAWRKLLNNVTFFCRSTVHLFNKFKFCKFCMKFGHLSLGKSVNLLPADVRL